MLRHLLLLAALLTAPPASALDSPLALREIYNQQVDRRLDLPADEQQFYAKLLAQQLQQAGLNLTPQYVLLVDRSPQVQALLLYWVADGLIFNFIGASPVSTGKAGGFDYFETPTGIFAHSIDNFDFRAEGTFNSRGLRGYGIKGMRVFDFGWVQARRTWLPGESEMRFLIHATDPARLEWKLGTPQSKGCIRIPASLNRLIDYYGLLDADYEQAVADGEQLWVLRHDRQRTLWSGRYLVVVDTNRSQRPAWSPLPSKK
jgi:hypothetical protein